MDNPYTYTLCQSKMIYVINRVINHDKLQSNLRAKQVKCHINTPVSHHLSTFGLLITHVDNVKKKKKRRKRNEFTYPGKRRKEKKN